MTLPTAPSRTMDQDTFDATTDAFIGALPQFETDMNTANAATVAAAAAAALSEAQAAASATLAIAGANAVRWVSGTTYALDDAVFSPLNNLTYRRIVAGAGTTDPSLDPTNWAKVTDDHSDARNPKARAQNIILQGAGGQTSGQAGPYITDNANHRFTSGDFSILWVGALPDMTPSASAVLMSKSNNTVGYYLGWSTTSRPFVRLTTVNHVPTASAIPLTDGTTHSVLAVVSQSTLTINYYIDGVFWTSSTMASTYDVSAGNTARVQVNGLTTTRYAGSPHMVALFNRALTAAEALDLYLNGISYADKWGSQTGQTSGTLTTGKRYRITTFVAGDDFTNIGAASNTTGVEFVATGTTPTTWTNGSTINAIGATLALEAEGIQANQWHDSSSNEAHADYPTTGWSLARWTPAGTYHWNTAITADTTLTSIVPAGYELERIVFLNSTANAVSVRLGTTASGTEVFGLTALNTSATFGGFKSIQVAQAFSLTAAQTLYLSSTSWNSASLTATFYFRRIT